jgi:hypothetical protein
MLFFTAIELLLTDMLMYCNVLQHHVITTTANRCSHSVHLTLIYCLQQTVELMIMVMTSLLITGPALSSHHTGL